MTGDPLIVLRRAIAVHESLAGAGIAHAVGGALALAYHVGDARATQDIDLNVFLPASRAIDALRALPPAVPWDDGHRVAIERDAQVRIRWPADVGPPIPLDLFFSEHELHEVAGRRALWVRMLDTDVPILAATDLTVFKALSSRTKDWADIEAVLEEAPPSLDAVEAIDWLVEIVGPDDPRVARLRALLDPPPT